MSISALRENPPKSFAQLLEEKLSGIAVLQAEQLELLEAHYRLLVRWNDGMNLTTIRSLEDIVVRHYAESIFLATLLGAATPQTVLDFGSGAGFPGIPVAIFRPEWHLTLLESNQRKAVFLREATRRLPNVTVLAQRAERISGHWNWVLSRAVQIHDVVALAVRCANHVAALVGETDAREVDTPMVWADPIKVPWGEKRVVVIGDVSRET